MRRRLIILAFLIFLSIGLSTGLLGVAWPAVRQTYLVPLDAVGLVLVMTAAGFLITSFFSGWMAARWGAGAVLIAGHVSVALGMFAHALAPVWWIFVLGGLFRGLGAGVVDAGLNAFAARHFNARILNWLHAGFGVGATISPLWMTLLIAQNASWRWGYVLAGVVPACLALVLLLTVSLWDVTHPGPQQPASQPAIATTLRLPNVWLGLAVFVVYTGAESTTGQWVFTLFTASRGISAEAAGLGVSAYWGGLTIGRFILGYAIPLIGTHKLVRGAILGALLGAALVWIQPAPLLNLLGVTLMGFSFAPIFPSLTAETPGRVGTQHTANAVGFQLTAAEIGIGLFPAIVGILAERTDMEIIGLMLVAMCLLLLVLHEVLARSATLPLPSTHS